MLYMYCRVVKVKLTKVTRKVALPGSPEIQPQTPPPIPYHATVFNNLLPKGECWAGNDQNELKKDGDADKDKCLVKLGAPPYGQYCPSKSEQEGLCHPQLCVGVQKTNYVYEMLQGMIG